MSEHLSPDGVCIVIPCIFTGIVGGHDPDWYKSRVSTKKSDTAWNHLLDEKFNVDTFLNKLSRREYDEVFEQANLDCVSQTVVYPMLGV